MINFQGIWRVKECVKIPAYALLRTGTRVIRGKISRSVVIFLLALLSTFPSMAQDDLVITNCPEGYQTAPARHVLKVTDEMPSWPGCEKIEFPAYREDCTYKEVERFVKENLVYPENAREMGLEGEVWIRFIVEENGCLSNISISKTLGGHTGWAAQKLVRSMPYWNPGYKTGYFFPVQVSIPIVFELNK
jgi:TonB family protein